MRLDLNLATQPYENARDFFVRWAALLAAALVLTSVLVWLAAGGVLHARDVTQKIREQRAEIERLKQEEKQAEAVLNRPQNAEIRRRSALLNELIAAKAFSWTQVFTDLEKIMPTRIHVVSIRPELNVDNEHYVLQIRMTVAGDSREKALELLRKMEDSPHFEQPQLDSETGKPEQPGGEMQFQISAIYLPQLPGTAVAVAAEGATGR